jgi:hypothetical protein
VPQPEPRREIPAVQHRHDSIVHRPTGAVVFIGRMMDPSTAKIADD